MSQESRERELVIVGASSAVAGPLLEVIEEAELFSGGQVHLLDNSENVGLQHVFAGKSLQVEELEGFGFSADQIVLFFCDAVDAAKWMPLAQKSGAWCVDASGLSRGDESVPFVHPLFNGQDLQAAENRVAGLPVAAAAMLREVLAPFGEAVDSVQVTLCQPVSELGNREVELLAKETTQLFNGQEPEVDPAIGQRLAFSQMSAAGKITDTGYTFTELSLIHDLKALLPEGVKVAADVMTVPVFHGLLANIRIRLAEPMDTEQVSALLGNGARLKIVQNPSSQESLGKEETLVGRIRADLDDNRTVILCAASDNLRKDVAMNCLQIVRLLLKNY
ncbi:Asd/ArgC dimerization domain-containing protein [Biformimicrobium ophioploci]|uniref:Aspartate-semialdehyde dehydrogenase n=1 Tax=Biformimicrobium ophioploci TaxID=3036711 RepID=A0ABQ6LZE1_9GAMM|nr:Asd/ArgC dimerization domain-containing protein [Microbulbifer sp. NKW57]GMG87461.1 aspartate-semialdehyde dehydrogenase [Microbulbifer sp. NKW57]